MRTLKPQVASVPEEYKSNACPRHILTVGDLMAQLAHFPADLPVGEDEMGIHLSLLNGCVGQAGDPRLLFEEGR